MVRSMSIEKILKAVQFLKLINGFGSAAHSMGVIRQGYIGVGVPGDLCNKPDFRSGRLHGTDESVARTVRSDIRKPARCKRRPPIVSSEILISEGKALSAASASAVVLA